MCRANLRHHFHHLLHHLSNDVANVQPRGYSRHPCAWFSLRCSLRWSQRWHMLVTFSKLRLIARPLSSLPRPVLTEKFRLAPTGKSPLRVSAILSHQEGRLAIATTAGQGAADAASRKACEEFGGRRSRVVLTPRRWRQNLRVETFRLTVTTSPVHRGERGVSR